MLRKKQSESKVQPVEAKSAAVGELKSTEGEAKEGKEGVEAVETKEKGDRPVDTVNEEEKEPLRKQTFAESYARHSETISAFKQTYILDSICREELEGKLWCILNWQVHARPRVFVYLCVCLVCAKCVLSVCIVCLCVCVCVCVYA